MFENAKYIAQNGTNVQISVEINGNLSFVPINPANSDYAAIMALVEAGELTIAPAEGAE